MASRPNRDAHAKSRPTNEAARQEHQTPLGAFVLYHPQPHAMTLRLGSWPLCGKALVHVCHLHRLARGLLHTLGQLAHKLSLLLVGWCHMQGASRCPRVSTAACTFVPFL